MKTALRNSVLYFAGAGIVYFSLPYLGGAWAHLGLMLFSLVHLVGLCLVALAAYATGKLDAIPTLMFFIIPILVNSLIVFALTLMHIHWTRR